MHMEYDVTIPLKIIRFSKEDVVTNAITSQLKGHIQDKKPMSQDYTVDVEKTSVV